MRLLILFILISVLEDPRSQMSTLPKRLSIVLALWCYFFKYNNHIFFCSLPRKSPLWNTVGLTYPSNCEDISFQELYFSAYIYFYNNNNSSWFAMLTSILWHNTFLENTTIYYCTIGCYIIYSSLNFYLGIPVRRYA